MNLSVQQVKEQDTEKERTRKINDTAINLDNRIKALKLKVDELEELYYAIDETVVPQSTSSTMLSNIGVKIVNLDPVNTTIDETTWVDGDSILILCDASSGSFSFNLPSAITVKQVTIYIKKIDLTVNTVTVNPILGQMIDQYI
jgi:hypothetical protein